MQHCSIVYAVAAKKKRVRQSALFPSNQFSNLGGKLLGGCFFCYIGDFARSFFNSSACFFCRLFTSCHEQLNCVHLSFLCNFCISRDIFGCHFCLRRCKICYCFCIICWFCFRLAGNMCGLLGSRFKWSRRGERLAEE